MSRGEELSGTMRGPMSETGGKGALLLGRRDRVRRDGNQEESELSEKQWEQDIHHHL